LDGKALLIVLVPSVDSVMSLEQVSGEFVRLLPMEKDTRAVPRGIRMEHKTYRRAKLMWQVKHLKGLTLVSFDQRN
jgi:hypothetical protein